jgi:phospholipid transport system transporter-binding protein
MARCPERGRSARSGRPFARAMSEGTFAVEGDRWRFTGALTFDDAMPVLEASAALPLPSSGVVDLSGMAHADSAALAVLLALRRRATAENRRLAFASVPPMLDSLARVYGIEEFVTS